MMQTLKSPTLRSGAERTSASIGGMSMCASRTAPRRKPDLLRQIIKSACF
jgi:hypothetical protein